MAGCSGKRRHKTQTSAIAAALRLSRRGHPLRVYRCPTCGDWHLTKRPTWTNKETA